jgi:hypothetical protein
VLGRVDPVDAGRHDGHRSAGAQRTAMSGAIDAPGEAADDDNPPGRQVGSEPLGGLDTRHRRRPGPDNRDGRADERLERALVPKQRRAIGDGQQPPRIARIVPWQEADRGGRSGGAGRASGVEQRRRLLLQERVARLEAFGEPDAAQALGQR